MESVINYIFKQVAENRLSSKEAKALLNELQNSKMNAVDSIAIIGMACRLPHADNVNEYWENILNNTNCIIPFPESRRVLPKELNLEHLYPYGGYLDEIDKFDASFFRLSPKEAKWMEPCQRMMLETAFAAVEDSGYGLEKLYGTKTGVYIGHDRVMGKDYRQYCIDMQLNDPLISTGSYPSILSRRISHILNLTGPSMVIDCACSSGIAAVHTACEAIKNNECSMAVAGSAFIRAIGINDAGMSVIESENHLQRSFDDRSSGTIWGEGIAAVILKPLGKALEDRDNIYAVIKGSVLNNDGVSGGLVAPNAKSQEELLVSAWKKLKVNPENISYIEAHGTGTKIGDPIEIMSITNAFRRFTQKRQFCGIGTVKTNIGHTVSTSGIASLIKVALSLKNKKLPATINFNTPNRFIDFCDSPVYVNDKLKEWNKNDSPRIAAINAFGFSGTNCHMILEEAPEPIRETGENYCEGCVLALSAKEKELLEKTVQNYIRYLDSSPVDGLEDICYTADTGRGHYEYRLAVIAHNRKELGEKLSEVLNKGFECIEDKNVYYGVNRIVNRAEDSDESIGFITKTEKSKISSTANRLLSEKPGTDEYRREMMELAAGYYVKGADIKWEESVFRGQKRRRVSLPVYPFKRECYWSSLENQYWMGSRKEDEADIQNNTEDNTVYKNVKLVGRKSDGEYLTSERKLAQIWSEILGYSEINIHDNFFEIGGDSISLMKMISAIQAEFGVNISYNRFVEEGSIVKLAEILPDVKEENNQDIYFNREPDKGNLYQPFPMTDVQLAYMTGRDSRYELGGVVTYVYSEYKTRLDIDRLNYSLNKVVQRHPMLHTVFSDDARQRILEDIPEYKIEVTDISSLGKKEQEKIIISERQKYSHYYFDPHQWPLFLFKALKLSDGLYQLFVGFDMLIADGTSLQFIARDMMYYYSNPEGELNNLDFTFRDYIMAYYEFRKSEVYKAAKKYWLDKLEDFPSSPALPLKMSAEDVGKPQFKRCHKTIDGDSLAMLRKNARMHNISLSAVLCTAYAEVLAFWSNQYRLAINLTVFNRHPFNKQVHEIVGDFTSIMVLEIDLKSGTSFWERAKTIQKVIMEALENRYYDGVEFIREISKSKALGNKAVMPIVFTSMISGNTEGEQSTGSWNQLGDLEMSISQTPQVYIDNQAMEMDGRLSLTWDYVQQLFEENIINAMFEQYTCIISSLACQDGNYRISITDDEISFIDGYNSTFEDIPETTLHELFIGQAKRTPGNIAVEFEDKKLTYGQLHNMSNQVAHYLKEQGIKPGDKVAVSVKRCEMTIVNILGIIKAGAAYVPMEPDYPEERKAYIVSNSGCRLTVDCDLYHTRNLAGYSCDDIRLGNADDVAYIIYTSGSTGKPKGVIISHKAAANTIIDINRKFGVNENDRILGISSMCFDLSVYDIFGALSTGAALVMIQDQRDVRSLIDAVENKSITVWNSVPAIMEMLVDNINAGSEAGRSDKAVSLMVNTGKPRPAEVECRYGKDMLYWSPAFQWKKDGEIVKIGNFSYSGVAALLFPELYFIMQDGSTVEALQSKFPHISREKIIEFVDELVSSRILLNKILNPDEIFRAQQRLFKNEYSEEIIYNPVELEKYKLKQLSRVHMADRGNKIMLPGSGGYCAEITERRTVRVFNENEEVSFERFAKMLSILRQKSSHNHIYYNYASAGGLYPIDVFIHIKAGRVEGIKEGLYYYSPVDNSIGLVTDTMDIRENCHYFTNKEIFKSSAFSVFLVYNAEANMPKYGSRGYFYACLDAGILTATINYAAELAGIGMCSIGNMIYGKIEKYFGFNENQVLIHTIEGGLKNEAK